jgi:3-phosphoshikimate 1-carboxyvinyltransferase
LSAAAVIYRKKRNSIFCGGKLAGREFALPGNVSSQYFSGLLFAVAASGGGGRIEILGDLESEGYIDMTRSVLNDFGVPAVKKENVYEVLPGGFACSPGKAKIPKSRKTPCRRRRFYDFRVEGDWSNAAFWLVAGAVSGN